MRLIFVGAGDFALPVLEALIASPHEIALVLSRPARPAGRGRRLTATPVSRLAETAGLVLATPATLADPALQAGLRELAPDALVVIAYGALIPLSLLALPRYGGLNVHPSLLPRWRGAAPVARAIAAGDRETGVAIMQMEAGLDSGPILALARLAIGDEETAGELTSRLARRGAALLLDTLGTLASGEARATPQRGAASYARKVTAAEARLNFGDSAATLARRIRAFNPRPGAWTQYQGERIRLLRATAQAGQAAAAAGTIIAAGPEGFEIATADGMLRISELQRAGRRIQPAATLAQDGAWIGRRLQ